jgi:phage terminase large subunit-like protein
MKPQPTSSPRSIDRWQTWPLKAQLAFRDRLRAEVEKRRAMRESGRAPIWTPQPGPQTVFAQCTADIAIYGGSAGSGKTAALLMEPLKYITNSAFGAVIFRRTSPQITNEGGLWDESELLYPAAHGQPVKGLLEWRFPSGAKVTFEHLQHEEHRFDWSGAQIPLLMFDELFTFTEKQFWFLQARNRSTCGVKPYTRATTNPDPESFVAHLIAWWIDQETGFPLWERSGVLRWLLRVGDELCWFDSYDAAKAQAVTISGDVRVDPLSLTFIPGTLDDNQKLLEIDPGYRSKLHALPYVERMQLLGGNWKVKPEAGKIFLRDKWEIVAAVPADMKKRVRAYDKAGTEGAGKWSVGVRMAAGTDGCFYVEDVVRGQWGALQREAVIKQTAHLDGHGIEIWHEQEPGSGGKESAESTTRNLAGFIVHAERVTGAKTVRARPYAAQQQAGNIKLLEGAWNKAFIDEHTNFGPLADEGKLVCDQVDAAGLSFTKLTSGPTAPVMVRYRA